LPAEERERGASTMKSVSRASGFFRMPGGA
jgi:hypothetical protein